jgi:hypothetical protein
MAGTISEHDPSVTKIPKGEGLRVRQPFLAQGKALSFRASEEERGISL